VKRYCLALDLKNDPLLIHKYIEHHKRVWPEIIQSIKNSGVLDMQIYHISDRLFMIMEVADNFSFEKKNKMDSQNPFVIKWEELMANYQKNVSFTSRTQKWVLMDKIFELA
jgi:L-rhamnose mutarotase|tara:strand:- start:107 stop:439 length:333 start_codon:yes stop_codon:yes gene_type:complete